MSITISGDGSITGLVSGGLPDGSVTAADLASGAITSGALPSGSVIQVVNAVDTTDTSTTSQTFIDTGLSTTITPTNASNTLIIMYSAPVRKLTSGVSAADNGAGVGINYNGSIVSSSQANYIGWNASAGAYNQETYSNSCAVTAGTTSSVTVKLQIKCMTSGGNVNVMHDVCRSSLTIFEVAA